MHLQDKDSLWTVLHRELEAIDQDLFAFPQAAASCHTFKLTVRSPRFPISLVIEEAQELGNLDQYALDTFLRILKEVRDTLGSDLAGMTLVGPQKFDSTLLHGGSSSSIQFNHVCTLNLANCLALMRNIPPPPPRPPIFQTKAWCYTCA